MRRSVQVVIVGLSAVLLSGCAQYQAQQAQKQAMTAAQAMQSVCHQAEADSRLDPTREQIADSPLKVTVAQMADTRRPTPLQRDAIEHRQDYLQPCILAMQQYLSTYSPSALPIYQEGEQNERALLAQLLSGNMTFGQFNTARSKSATTTWTAMQNAERESIAQAQQLQLRQQQAAGQAAQNDFNLMRALTPRTATCTGFGNSVTCTSQ